jgi:hypothetical protein
MAATDASIPINKRGDRRLGPLEVLAALIRFRIERRGARYARAHQVGTRKPKAAAA